VMHGAVGRDASSPDVKLDKSAFPKIVALVMFGDPGFATSEGMRGTRIAPFPAELFPKVRENCAAKDPVRLTAVESQWLTAAGLRSVRRRL
jgi:hypothetical protein